MFQMSYESKFTAAGYAQIGKYYDYAAKYQSSLRNAKAAAQVAHDEAVSKNEQAEYAQELLNMQLEQFEKMKEIMEDMENYKK